MTLGDNRISMDGTMKTPLQAWYDAWLTEHRDTNLIYVSRNGRGEAYLDQVHYVRDTLAGLVWQDILYSNRPAEPPPRTDCNQSAWVIGEHRSKSVRLPVYSLERPDLGIQFVLRDNYYDWKLSVISETPIESDLFSFLFYTTPPVEPDYTGNQLSPVYFEGFPEDLVFGYHSQNPHRWSASLGDRALWTTILICMRAVGAAKPRTWHTRESHRVQLDAESAALEARLARDDAARKRQEEARRG